MLQWRDLNTSPEVVIAISYREPCRSVELTCIVPSFLTERSASSGNGTPSMRSILLTKAVFTAQPFSPLLYLVIGTAPAKLLKNPDFLFI
jgi:hypothetical protein